MAVFATAMAMTVQGVRCDLDRLRDLLLRWFEEFRRSRGRSLLLILLGFLLGEQTGFLLLSPRHFHFDLLFIPMRSDMAHGVLHIPLVHLFCHLLQSGQGALFDAQRAGQLLYSPPDVLIRYAGESPHGQVRR